MLKCLRKILEMIGSAGRAMRPGIVEVLAMGTKLNFQKRRRPEGYLLSFSSTL